jgi:hypothetical protein
MARRLRAKRLKRGKRLRRLAAVVLVSAALLSTSLAAGLLLSGLISGGPSGPRTAAIVDQLSLTEPNPAFAETATEMLEQAGYAVDYYAGEQVTVDLYRNLPAHGYDLIILRAHASRMTEIHTGTGEKRPADYVALFTNEPYSEAKYGQEHVRALGRAVYYEGGDPLFGITPYFVTESMRGRFDNTLIIMTGCDGLRSPRTGEPFLDRGATAFVSWTKRVSAAHSDAATERLLEYLLISKLTAREAVARTMADVGPDPTYGSTLLYYP